MLVSSLGKVSKYLGSSLNIVRMGRERGGGGGGVLDRNMPTAKSQINPIFD